MRKSNLQAKKQTNSKSEAQRGPTAKKSQSDNRIPNIATMDNGTMIEAFKFLNYYQLATSSHVSKRFWNLISTHRHKLALLDVEHIYINTASEIPTKGLIDMFNKKLSSKTYNEWIVCNGYSKQIPFEGQVALMQSTEKGMYELSVGWNEIPENMPLYIERADLNNENWPLFQHFTRLLLDPFIYIRCLSLSSFPEDLFQFLAGAMDPDRDRLQCKQLDISFNANTRKLFAWIKDHVHCDLIVMGIDNGTNCDEDLLDLFMTGSPCTSEISVDEYDLSKVIVDLVQKFLNRKNRDEYQPVKTIIIIPHGVVKELKRNFGEFAEEQNEDDPDEDGQLIGSSRQLIGFINNDIEKKFTVNVEKLCELLGSFSIKITDL